LETPESVKELIRKIHALSIRGVGGESDAALRKLDLLLAKYHVTLDDILEDTVKTYQFAFKNEWDENLMMQLYYAVTKDRERKVWSYSKRGKKVSRKIGLDLTAEQYVDYQEQLAYYRDIWKKELKRLFSAFCHKHDLLRPSAPDVADRLPSREEMQEYLRMIEMMRGLGEKSFFKPMALLSA